VLLPCFWERVTKLISTQLALANRILSHISKEDLALLSTDLSPVELPLRRQLEIPNRNIEHVYFPTRGFASVVAKVPGGSIEVGLIGSESMSGLAVIMGASRTQNSTYMQSAGSGYRVTVSHLRHCMEVSPTLRLRLLRFGHAFLMQVAQTAAVNARNKLEERLARWLLMAADRSDGNELHLTHEFLAIMLGVRRAGVTIALGFLESKALIRIGRGKITILDRPALVKLSNGAYTPISDVLD
jgi:CRP-like cAMP-binding protein